MGKGLATRLGESIDIILGMNNHDLMHLHSRRDDQIMMIVACLQLRMQCRSAIVVISAQRAARAGMSIISA